jgi:hypothetical protein
LRIRREALGDRHPMVATAIGNVGLVLQRLGDLSAAEPLLREALEIRLEALGAHHPDYGASLSHLGSLLLERHDHAAAEPLLRQAVTIRREALGPSHPDVLADLQALEAIPQGRCLPTVVAVPRGPAPEVVAIPAAASDRALEQLARGPREIADEARRMAETFGRVAVAMAHAARGMQLGHPPDMRVLNDAAVCHNAYAALRDEALHRADALGLAPAEGTSLALADLAALMDRVARLEEEIPRRAAALSRAMAALDRVLSLRHRVPSESPLLRTCREAASALRPALAAARLAEGLPDDASLLASGAHPLAALVRLVDSGDSLGDEDWSHLHHVVRDAFGRPLAAAAIRGRLVIDLGRSASLNGSAAP